MLLLSSLLSLGMLMHVTLAVNPGVKARVTQKGLTYANSVAQAQLAHELQTLQIPNQSGDDGHIHWDLSNIQNRGVTPPSSQIVLDPAAHGLKWTLANLGISLHADWRIKYKKGWVKASTSGSVDMRVNGASMTVAIALGINKAGGPSISTASCSASIAGVDLDFHGGTGWLINLFKHRLEDKVKGLMQGQICNVVTKEINTNGNEALAKLKLTVDVAKRFLLDYRLIAPPVVTGTYMDILDKGEMFWKADVKEAPFTPQPIPASGDVSRMLYMWLTDYTANTFTYAAQTHGFLVKNISKDDLPAKSDSYLNTTCKTVCIGKLIPQIGEKYPNSQVMMALNSTSTPELVIQPKGIELGMKINIDLFAEAPGKPPAFMLTINMTMFMAINATVQNEKLTGKITEDHFKFAVEKSAIGPVNSDRVNTVLSAITILVVVPQLNDLAAKGLDLPVTGSVKFSNTQLQLLNGSVMIATDLAYAPSVHQERESEELNRLTKLALQKRTMSFKVV